MAATPQEQLDALNDAIANGGILRVKQVDGSEVMYSSLDALFAARDKAAADVAAGAGEAMFVQQSFGDPRE